MVTEIEDAVRGYGKKSADNSEHQLRDTRDVRSRLLMGFRVDNDFEVINSIAKKYDDKDEKMRQKGIEVCFVSIILMTRIQFYSLI